MSAGNGQRWVPMLKLALPAPGFRRGLLGSLPVGPEYMAGVRARARMLTRACRVERAEVAPSTADARQLQITQTQESRGNTL